VFQDDKTVPDLLGPLAMSGISVDRRQGLWLAVDVENT
jgi:hypothetical protein